MLHIQTVEARTLDLIKELMADSQLSDFNLVGGTALSLKLGHTITNVLPAMHYFTRSLSPDIYL